MRFANAKPFPGVDPDTSVRVSLDENTIIVDALAAAGYQQKYRCILGGVLGGALDSSEFWPWENDVLSAQNTCGTELSFDDAIDHVREKHPDWADFIVAKSQASTEAIKISDKKTANEVLPRILQEAADAAAKLAKPSSLAMIAAVALVGLYLASRIGKK